MRQTSLLVASTLVPLSLGLGTQAHAGRYTDTFGGAASTFPAQDLVVVTFFEVEHPVTITGVEAWLKKGPSGTGLAYLGIWTRNGDPSTWGSSSSWTPADLVAIAVPSTSFSWVNASTTLELEAGDQVGLGFLSYQNIVGSFDLSVSNGDPSWGVLIGDTRQAVSSSNFSMGAMSGTGEVHLRISAEVADVDEDGWDAAEDCDDTDLSIHPGASETWYDGIDQDCSGGSDFDRDGDGFDSLDHGGEDCDDDAALAFPGADEIWYDGIDGDCQGGSDFDQDGDGFDSADFDGEDCDDLDGERNPEASETWYDGIDSDCSGGSDFDQDGDGFDADTQGGEDCDDEDFSINPAVEETWYDGIDSDCLGGSDFDQDGDSHEALAHGGDDCNDQNPEAWEQGDPACADDPPLDGDGLTGQGDGGKGGIGCTALPGAVPVSALLLAGILGLRRRR